MPLDSSARRDHLWAEVEEARLAHRAVHEEFNRLISEVSTTAPTRAMVSTLTDHYFTLRDYRRALCAFTDYMKESKSR
jgi:hypothetical protein